MKRCDSAAMVSNTSDDLPDPEKPALNANRAVAVGWMPDFGQATARRPFGGDHVRHDVTRR
jgi:hypothetical protein